LAPLFLSICVIGLLSMVDAAERKREDLSRHYSGVYFWTPDVGWVADVQDIVLTRDGGRTWAPILSVYGPPRGFEGISRIGILNPQVWWFEDAGNLWTTTDQGQTWRSQRLPNMGEVVFVTPREAWGRQTGGAALTRTQDGGRTWQAVPLPGIDTRRLPIQRLTFVSPQVGWAEVGDGSVAQTTDGGQTWGLRGKAPGGFRLFVFANAQTGFALDLRAPKIYRTRDGGATWETAQLSLAPGVRSIDSLHALDPLTAWAVGARGTILQTTDGGATWQRQTSGTSRDLAGIHFVDRQHGWAVGFANTILKTTDGGQTWTKVDDDLKNWRP
jgi:photosystem II stability/assembly factor-like uncharacterized protein